MNDEPKVPDDDEELVIGTDSGAGNLQAKIERVAQLTLEMNAAGRIVEEKSAEGDAIHKKIAGLLAIMHKKKMIKIGTVYPLTSGRALVVFESVSDGRVVMGVQVVDLVTNGVIKLVREKPPEPKIPF